MQIPSSAINGLVLMAYRILIFWTVWAAEAFVRVGTESALAPRKLEI